MSLVERSGEILARRVNRRRFLVRAAAVTFATATGIAVTLPKSPSAFAALGDCYGSPQTPPCDPPGYYCTHYSSSYCNGAACSGGCNYDTFDYPTACWGTTVQCANCRTVEPYCYHYKCCDCSCPGGVTCGCSQYIEDCRGCIRAPTNNINNIPDCIPCC